MLTICLVTQGRKEVQEFLESAERLSTLEHVNFLIIDNGSPKEISDEISNWATIHSRVEIVRLETNTTDFNEIWSTVEKYGSEWVTFPGDDDRLLVEGIIQWHSIVIEHSDVEVTSMSAKIIDQDGFETGETVGPEYVSGRDKASQIAHALHAPPFFWPTLFFKKSLIRGPFPHSRFVLDWWISLNLLMKTDVLESTVCTLEYRRHSLQESNLVSLNRKYFEGIYHLDDFLNSKNFLAWITSLKEEDLINFWNVVYKSPPIYAERDMANVLLFRIAKLVIASSSSAPLHNQILADLSLTFGSLQHDHSFSDFVDVAEKSHFGNLRITNGLSCPILAPLFSDFQGSKSAQRVEVYCEHGSKVDGGVFIQCDKYRNIPRSIQRDVLVRDISEKLEEVGMLAFRISSRERFIVMKLRKYKSLLPKKLISKLRRAI